MKIHKSGEKCKKGKRRPTATWELLERGRKRNLFFALLLSLGFHPFASSSIFDLVEFHESSAFRLLTERIDQNHRFEPSH